MRILELKSRLLFVALVAIPGLSLAEVQPLDDQEILNVESIYKSVPTTTTRAEQESATTPESAASAVEFEATPGAPPTSVQQKVENLTDLNRLSPFREVSVIQKKYLPKTERFQLYAGAGMTTNSPWFLNLGVKVNFGYYFTESFGVELSGVFLSNSEREVAKEIRDNNNLQPEKFVNTKNYMGVDLVWAPIYGKISMLNNRIIPFDMYFSAGGGTSSTNSQESNVATLHVGLGQIFAITKAIAFRWDYSWTSFQATPFPDSATAAAPQKNAYNDLILTAGLSFFFPEAKYR
ncbi:MAG: hypothetical protein A2622_08185 [Bdellovibrionales bacterium RIFCSPHIGHO2_01_FULL_40_29]|nr:MAG: hypothetical protein A2622_08185 [Bdellovibrionales bacterium RIFCSPHIGHO2_01_FULL_40_29]OFZ35474.1 MAG: hypothetical protein A3D17_07420 [Bdellovibrionales bacterium RIFCSPHIGHO2_02_FULL_40_15]